MIRNINNREDMNILKDLIDDIKNDNKNLKRHFSSPEDLIKALSELQSVIGMKKLKNQVVQQIKTFIASKICLLYTSPSPRDGLLSRMPSSA